jgi:plasmid stabilization system protein ParE
VTRFKVAVLPDAEAELREAFLWYFDKSPLAADAFGTEVEDAIDGLEGTAADWPKDDDGVHFYHLKHFPYTLRYEIVRNEVTVLAVAPTPCAGLLGTALTTAGSLAV